MSYRVNDGGRVYMSTNPFDFVNSINSTKEDIMTDENEKDYNSFLVNRSLSYFSDTVFIANEINYHSQIDNKLKYHFLLNIVRKRKRFAKWIKPDQLDDMALVKEYYEYSNEKARSALSILSPDNLNVIRSKVNKGGRK